MTAEQLVQDLTLTVFALPRPEAAVSGGYAGDLLSWVMGRAMPGDAWLTIMSNVNVAAVALMAEVSCVILAEGVLPDEELLRRAREQGVNLLGCAQGVFPLSVRLAALLDS